MSKIEFGRHVQGLLNDRNWTQSDLVREIAKMDGQKLGRDSISKMINGHHYPQPKTVSILCKVFGITREELFPNGEIDAAADEVPAFEVRAAHGHPGKAWVRINRMMSFDAAAEITVIINAENKRDAAGG